MSPKISEYNIKSLNQPLPHTTERINKAHAEGIVKRIQKDQCEVEDCDD